MYCNIVLSVYAFHATSMKFMKVEVFVGFLGFFFAKRSNKLSFPQNILPSFLLLEWLCLLLFHLIRCLKICDM